MRKYDGSYREMTPDEIAEMERMAAENQPPELTPEERIAQLEEALDMILHKYGGITGG